MIQVYAAETPYVIARLGKNASVAYSPEVQGTHKFFDGTNRADSAVLVYFSAQRKVGIAFVTDTQKSVKPGNALPPVLTNFTSKEVSWRLKLNPSGAKQKDCYAVGYMWYEMK